MSTAALSKLPTYADLVSMDETKSKENDLQVLLNQPPPNQWLRDHPTAKTKDQNGRDVPAKYIPIDKVEYLLTKIFIEWSVEIKDIKIIANSAVVTIRLHYNSPITGQAKFQDGIGAAPLQTDKEAGAIDFNRIKSSAVQIACPAAETYAIKDAAEKLGRIFGKDLNRRDIMNYNDMLGRFQKQDISKEEELKIIKNQTELMFDQISLNKYMDQLKNEGVDITPEIRAIFNLRLENIKKSKNGSHAAAAN